MQILKMNYRKKSMLLDQIISMDEERLSLLSVVNTCSLSIRQYITWLSDREIRLIKRFRKKFGIYPPAGNDLVWLEFEPTIKPYIDNKYRNKI